MWDHSLSPDHLSEIVKAKENILFGSSLYFFLFFSMYGKRKQKYHKCCKYFMGKEKNFVVTKTNFCNFVLNICNSKYWNTTQTSDLGK